MLWDSNSVHPGVIHFLLGGKKILQRISKLSVSPDKESPVFERGESSECDFLKLWHALIGAYLTSLERELDTTFER